MSFERFSLLDNKVKPCLLEKKWAGRVFQGLDTELKREMMEEGSGQCTVTENGFKKM